jgi:MFS family permease
MSWANLDLSRTVERSFRAEKASELTLPGAVVLLEGGVVGVIAAKIYAVEPMTLALISAAPMFANLSSFFWSKIAAGRSKVAIACLLQALIIACVVAVALVPSGNWGAFVLVSSMIASRVLLAGVVTVRSVIWSLNYARHQRARATSQLQMINAVVTVLISSAIGPLLDTYPNSVGWIYWAGAVLGCLGLVLFAQVRVIGEVRQRVRERRERRDPETAIGFLEILRTDRLFRWYQVNMFAAGFGAMLVEAPLIFIITRQMQASYTESIALTMVIPFAVSLLSMPLWANYLDRVHVAQFRSRQSVLWILAQLLTMIGAILGSFVGLVIARTIMGIARGGGSLAWQLGHNDFAKPDQLGAYMGLHVTLTGVRGAIAPFLGIILYAGWRSGGLMPGSWEGVGAGVFGVAAVISGLSGWGFYRLYRTMKREGSIALRA